MQFEPLTLTNGTAISAAVNLNGSRNDAIRQNGVLAGIVIPVATNAATLAIHGSVDGTNFFALKGKTGTAVTIVGNAAGYYALSPDDVSGVSIFRLVAPGNVAATANIVAAIRS